MPGNSFGQLFKITTFGESHGGSVGAVVDGCPPGLELSEADIQPDLDRRKPGQSRLTTPREETDTIHILSGVFAGKTTGTPILLLANNQDARPEDYTELKNLYRPSHADFTYEAKYGFRDWRGSGRASARETLARVAAAAVAKKFLKEKLGVNFISYVEQVGSIKTNLDFNQVTLEQIESNPVRCPDQTIAKKMIELIESVKKDGDSIGGIIRGAIFNLPVGLGEPVFDKLPADLAKAMLSLPATKGFEFGAGFSGVSMTGSQHNDEFLVDKHGRVATKTNFSGGTQGGISNGQPLHFRVAFKPVSTIRKPQPTLNRQKQAVVLQAAGRHDPCVLPRAVPAVEAMAALVVMDNYLRHKAQNL